MNLAASDGAIIWRGLSEIRRNKIRDLASENKEQHKLFMQHLDDNVESNTSTGPLSSKHKRIPINIKKMYEELNQPNSPLRNSWNRENLKRWAKSLAVSKPPFKMSTRCSNSYHRTILTVVGMLLCFD